MKKRAFVAGALGTLLMAVGVQAQAAPAKARADLRDANGVSRGYVVLTEVPGAYLLHSINVSGQLTTGGTQQRGLTLQRGDCSAASGAFVGLDGHLSVGQQSHPNETGDLPNIYTGSTGTFSITKATNRFALSNLDRLNVFDLAGGGGLVAIVESGPDGGAPLLCGALLCEGGTDCLATVEVN